MSHEDGDREESESIAIQKQLIYDFIHDYYIGNLVQGKITTPNHKLKKVILKPKEQWDIIENTHQAIIDKEIFDIVQKLLLTDTRTVPDKQRVYPLSGLIYCADCYSTMIRNSVNIKGKKYVYLICGRNRTNKLCSSHNIRYEFVERVVFEAVKKCIDCFSEIDEVIEYIKNKPINNYGIKKFKLIINNKKQEIEKYKN